MDEENDMRLRVHEADTAVGLSVKNADPIHKVTILPRGRSPVTQSLPERDRWMKKREYLEDRSRCCWEAEPLKRFCCRR